MAAVKRSLAYARRCRARRSPPGRGRFRRHMDRGTVRGCGVNRGSVRGAVNRSGVVSRGRMNGCSVSTGSVRSRGVGSAALRGCRFRRRFGSVRRGVMRRGAMRFQQMLLRLRFGMMQRMLRCIQRRHSGSARGKNNQSRTNRANAGHIHPAISSQLWITCRASAHLVTHFLLPIPRPASSSDAGVATYVYWLRRFLAGRPLHRESRRPAGNFFSKLTRKTVFRLIFSRTGHNFCNLSANYTVFSPILELFPPPQAVSGAKTAAGAETWERRDRARAPRRVQEKATAQAARRAPPAPARRVELH